MSDELTPITRKETFLAKAGGQNVVTPTPITREETFLQAIIDNGSGGGGGSDLPAVTSEDAGKVLTVSNDGEWIAGAGGGGGGGGGVLIVADEPMETIPSWITAIDPSATAYETNVTYAQIHEAMTSSPIGISLPANTDFMSDFRFQPMVYVEDDGFVEEVNIYIVNMAFYVFRQGNLEEHEIPCAANAEDGTLYLLVHHDL